MIAGLPNNIRRAVLFVLASTILLALALPGLAEDVQTPSTTLDDVISLITQNENLSPAQETLLTSSITSVVTSGALTVDQALALVDLSGLADVTAAAQTPLVTNALSIVLDAVTTGDIDSDQASAYLADTIASGSLSALKDLTGTKTPMGIHTAISKLGASDGYDQEASDAVLAKVDELVAADVPPGIALRVARQLLKAGLDADEIIAQLDSLETSIVNDENAPGKAANEVTPQEQNKNQNQEAEMNQNNKGKNSPSQGKGNNDKGNASNGGNGSNRNSGNAGNKRGKG